MGESVLRSAQQSVDLQLREALAIRLNALIADQRLSQHEAGLRIGMPQCKVSQVRRLQLKNISVSKLLYALMAFEQDVDIVIRPCSGVSCGIVRVAA
jgi:predicted XRE-type DNA-binding protein